MPDQPEPEHFHRPWMPLYIGDYLRDTMHLTTEEHGAYVLLLMACWSRGGSLPDDDHFLANTARLDLRRWKKVRRVVQHFFVCDETVWRQHRIEREVALACTRSRHASAAASTKRHLREQCSSTAQGSQLSAKADSIEHNNPHPHPHVLSSVCVNKVPSGQVGEGHTRTENVLAHFPESQTPPTPEEVIEFTKGTTIPEGYARYYVEACHSRHRWFVKTVDGRRLIDWHRDLVIWWTKDRPTWKDPEEHANHKQPRQHGVKSRSEGTANEGHTTGYSAAAARQRLIQ